MSVIRASVLALAALSSLSVLHAEDSDSDSRSWRHHSNCTFAWQAQLDLPLKDLGQALDNRTGLGLGMQWNHEGRDGHASRTRLEWNVFPEGPTVGLDGVKTKASNYILSFDRLYHFSGEQKGLYVMGGLGAVRWFTDQTPALGTTQSSHTTKLGVSAGVGYRFNPSFSIEARYLLSNVSTNFDGNMLQAGLNMRF